MEKYLLIVLFISILSAAIIGTIDMLRQINRLKDEE